ncbi:MAG: hypothetical protein AUH89_05290 [Ktedonobacter sp. 13_1_40CM_4_52_4]|nr:MAG: hypothetical protein AUH89_05290 [Ktedonobacter sp. 13_1_40CM_4_52_4]
MKKLQRRGSLIPPWDMPSDPVKAVFWFFQWSLKVLVRFFWVPILAGIIYEGIVNGFVGGFVTLLVGLSVWLGLAVVLFFFNVGTRISRTVADVSRMQQSFSTRRSNTQFGEADLDESKIVEGTVTDLEEERRKRRRE